MDHPRAQGDKAKTVPQVLFVCTNNAGRSLMAAALVEHYAAGCDPAGRVLADVRVIRDDVDRRVRALLSDLGISVAGTADGR